MNSKMIIRLLSGSLFGNAEHSLSDAALFALFGRLQRCRLVRAFGVGQAEVEYFAVRFDERELESLAFPTKIQKQPNLF